MRTISELKSVFSGKGKVTYICVRPARLTPVITLEQAIALKDAGLEGDRYQSKGIRQITLIQKEHLDAVTRFMGKQIEPDLVRRNLVVEGINLLSLKGLQFFVGDAILEYSGECHPCSRMEENLGPGGYNALRGHGGITAKIVESGLIRLGSEVAPIIF